MNKSKSFVLFLVSGILILLTLIVATFWNALGLGNVKTPLALPLFSSFGISIAGLIIGINEIRKEKSRKLLIGFLGNILIILFFIFLIVYSFYL